VHRDADGDPRVRPVVAGPLEDLPRSRDRVLRVVGPCEARDEERDRAVADELSTIPSQSSTTSAAAP
jgi:hypothetical protein